MITTRQDKVRATIARVEARLAKLKAMTPEAYVKKYDRDEDWLRFDIKQAEEQLERNFKKFEEAKRLDAKEEERLAKANAKSNALDNIPQCLKDFAKEVVEVTVADKIRVHNHLMSLPYPKSNDWSNLAKAIRREHYDWQGEEHLRKTVQRDVDNMVLNLMSRVAEKCGNIISTDDLSVTMGNSTEGCAINGWIEGDKGNAYVGSIRAGGYNIQCLHIRVLVK